MALQIDRDSKLTLGLPDVAAAVTGILSMILGLSSADMAEREILDSDFSALGLNSVDYLEFVLNLERDLNVDITDEVLLRQDLRSARAWIAHLEAHWHEAATPDNAPAPGA